MSTAAAPREEKPTRENPSRPRWHLVYYLLAAFDVLAVLMGLYLTHQIMGIYGRSIEVNKKWVELLRDLAELDEAVAALNGPGNDIFQLYVETRKADRPRVIQEQAAASLLGLRRFNQHSRVLHEKLSQNITEPEAALILKDLHAIEAAAREIHKQSVFVFSFFRLDETAEAGKHMAAMDQQYVEANRALRSLREHVGEMQDRLFDEETRRAGEVQKFEYVLAGLLFVMVGGATVYGSKLARHAHRTEAILRQSHDELEQRVHERTAELTAANAAMQGEIEERRRAEEALRESEERYRQLIEGTHDMIQSVAADGRFLFVNRAWKETLGYSEADLEQRKVFDIVHPAALPHCRAAFARVMAGEALHQVEAMFLTKDGRTIAVDGNAAPRRLGEQVIATQGFFRDVTERRQAAELRRQLLRQLLSAQEDERRRMARELHDGIGQSITGLLLGLRTLAETPTLEAVRGRADDLREIALAALEDVRRLARGLRPSALDEQGLAAALENYVDDYQLAHEIPVTLDVAVPPEHRLPEEVETTLYRITQEALTNTARHAAAKHVDICLACGPGFVELTVVDDGQGFDPEAFFRDPAAHQHFGLSGMRERAVLLDGTFTLWSKPGEGTRIQVRLPLPEEDHGKDPRAPGG
jgi:PAS domain S-box-containing protein